MVMAPAFSAALAGYKVNNVRQFPELAWGANPGSINGLRIDINKTVSDAGSDKAIAGDFANSSGGAMPKKFPMEVIPYGDPDNSGGRPQGSQPGLPARLNCIWMGCPRR